MKNWQTMLIALTLSVFTWFLVTGREVVETWVEMPVVMTNPPQGMIIEDGLVDKIQVRLRGPKGLVDSLASQHLTYSLDVSHLRIGEQVLDIDLSNLPLTSSYEVIEVRPNRLTLLVDRRITKTIPVEIAWEGQLNNDYKLENVIGDPTEVELSGPETVLRKYTKTSVTLREDFPQEVPPSWTSDVALDFPEEVKASPAQIRVEAVFVPKTREIWVKIPLSIEAPKGLSAHVTQDYVRLQIEGPLALFRNSDFRKGMSATLLFGPEVVPGEFELDYDVILPEGCRLLKRNPEAIKTILKEK